MVRAEKIFVEFQQSQQQAHGRQWGAKSVELVVLWGAKAEEGNGFAQTPKIYFILEK